MMHDSIGIAFFHARDRLVVSQEGAHPLSYGNAPSLPKLLGSSDSFAVKAESLRILDLVKHRHLALTAPAPKHLHKTGFSHKLASTLTLPGYRQPTGKAAHLRDIMAFAPTFKAFHQALHGPRIGVTRSSYLDCRSPGQ